MDHITKLRVGKHTIGIRGLKEALAEAAERFNGTPDTKAGRFLLEKLSAQNYIAPAAAPTYEEAFHRAYLRHIGAPEEDAVTEGILEIKVLGPGCPQCERLEREIMTVMAEAGIEADLDHVRDLKEIASYGVMGTPALIINREVKAVGKVPSKTRLTAWLTEAAANT
ncbi:thioredoxin family protein [Desulfoluna butyratoxydans]|uniref:Thioredoxin-like fold n=1 Tax=Desulfoluna butyratoxydans TaxID=231438 RepID=A0A4U8YIH6_9BACT|nr:thioredoxin family protein [Desulfoluna butyratoxydans]VFQ43054.1 thioredoxin-like fold [Desulfoluna butyratoxydans]